MTTQIHPTAIIDKDANLGEDVQIGPYCTVGANVTIGSGTKLISHVVCEGRLEIGPGCTVHPFAYLGQPPQDMKYKNEDTAAKIGANNTIREYVTVHRASVDGDGLTEVGDNNYLMAYVHVAHDCKVGDHVIMANYAGLSGHVIIGDHVIVGGIVGVHQHVTVGAYTMLGGMSRIINDVPPYVIAAGADKARLYGLNMVGLKRKGFSDELVSELKAAYRILFMKKLPLADAIKRVEEEVPTSEHVQALVEFVRHHKRGLAR
jgi:UDP-N-acetylglucosamine acyltransferase